MMGNVDGFMTTLQEYDGRTMPDNEIPKIEVFVKDPEMSVEAMQKKSAAAANLWTWVVNIYGFNRIYVMVKPLMDALDEANASKAAADESLAAAQATVKRCENELQALQDKFEAATAEKQEVEEMAEACLEKLGLAERLVGGLASENERWGREIEEMKVSTNCLIGDCMVAAGRFTFSTFTRPSASIATRLAQWNPATR